MHKKMAIFTANLALSLFLLLLTLTNLSLPGTWPNTVFPPLMGAVSLILLFRVLLPSATKKHRRLFLLSSAPAVGCGCLPALFMLCMIIPPFTLGFLFALDEMTHEQHIQSAISPDGTRVAEVYFRGVGAYSGGNGRITVRVHSRFFPFIQWDVYHNGRSFASEESHDYVSWINRHELLISENQEKVSANRLSFSPDPILLVPILFIGIIIQAIASP